MSADRHRFQESLEIYARRWEPHFPERVETVARYREFVATDGTCCERSNLDRHITGSALVVSPRCDQVLLTHHAKLKKWIQLGGHCDGDHRVHLVAATEVLEESGLSAIFLDAEVPLDIDILPVPQWKGVPAHDHYDARYLMQADPDLPLAITEESLDLKWFAIDQAMELCEPTVQRMLRKLSILEDSFANERTLRG